MRNVGVYKMAKKHPCSNRRPLFLAVFMMLALGTLWMPWAEIEFGLGSKMPIRVYHAWGVAFLLFAKKGGETEELSRLCCLIVAVHFFVCLAVSWAVVRFLLRSR